MVQLPATCDVGSELADFDAKNENKLQVFIRLAQDRIKSDLAQDHPYHNWVFAKEARSASCDLSQASLIFFRCFIPCPKTINSRSYRPPWASVLCVPRRFSSITILRRAWALRMKLHALSCNCSTSTSFRSRCAWCPSCEMRETARAHRVGDEPCGFNSIDRSRHDPCWGGLRPIPSDATRAALGGSEASWDSCLCGGRACLLRWLRPSS